MDSNTTATITLAGFLAALVHLAHARAAAAVAPGGGPNTAAYTQLSYKLESLLHNCLQPNIFPDISRRVRQLLLLDSCDPTTAVTPPQLQPVHRCKPSTPVTPPHL